MLRQRPETCPRCGHDVREKAECPGCRGALVSEPLPSTAVWDIRPAPLGPLAVAAAISSAVYAPPAMALAVLAGAGIVLAGTAAARPTSRALARLGRRIVAGRRARGETITVRDAIAAIAADPSTVVTIRGRVRTLIPARGEAAACALRTGPATAGAGRFLVEDATGAALVDDDALVAVSRLGGPELVRATVVDGQEVIVRGRARVLVAGGYRGVDRELAFDGTREAPLEIVPL